jgi:protein SCO1/2
MNLSMSRLAVIIGVGALFLVLGVAGTAVLRMGSSGTTSIATGIATIGGPFALTDHNGRAFTQNNFRGRYMLVYFGYTYCPDVCPTTLTSMGDALRELGSAGDAIVPIFITVDPKRDTVDHLKVYVPYFHPRLVGLTGSAQQVAAAAKEFRIYFSKAPDKTAPAEDDSYLMDHSSIVYLMGPDGRFLTHFSHGTSVSEMVKKIRGFL